MSTNILAITNPMYHNGSEWDYAKEEFLSDPDFWLAQFNDGKFIKNKLIW